MNKLTKSNIFEKHPKKTLIIISIILFIVLDVFISKTYKYVFGHTWSQRDYYTAKKIEQSYRIFSKNYHHDLAKNIQIDNARWGNIKYQISTNSLGFKDHSVREIPVVSDDYRVIFIGDSFTEGIGIEYQKTFVGLIANALSRENIQVLNAGVSSYSPIIYWKKMEFLLDEIGLTFDELIVFLDISDIEDEAVYYTIGDNGFVIDSNQKPELKQSTLKDLIRNDTIITYFILNEIQEFYRHYYNNNVYAINVKRGLWTVDNDIFQSYGKLGLKKAALHMGLLFELLKKHNIKLTIAVYPWPDQIINNDLNSLQVSFWKNWAKEHNVRFINYFPYFIDLYNSEAANKLTLDTFFIKGDYHWNEKGHQLIAKTFLSWYKNRD